MALWIRPDHIIGGFDGGTNIIITPGTCPVCPSGKLAVVVQYIDTATGKVLTTTAYVTLAHQNNDRQCVMEFDRTIPGKVLFYSTYCVVEPPKKPKPLDPPPPSDITPETVAPTRYVATSEDLDRIEAALLVTQEREPALSPEDEEEEPPPDDEGA